MNKSKRKIFLSSTSSDVWSRNIREKVTRLLRSIPGIEVVRFEDMRFRERPKLNKYDFCLDKVAGTPEFLVLVGEKAGSDYKGRRERFKALKMVHAETCVALRKQKEIHAFILEKTRLTYDLWLLNGGRDGKKFKTGDIEKELFDLIHELDIGICKSFYTDGNLIKKLRQLFDPSSHK